MTEHSQLAPSGLIDARVPRYTSYPPANHFSSAIGPDEMTRWITQIPEGDKISLYVHVPFCRRLCWFCACRTQGTKTDAPLRSYVDTLKLEIAQMRALMPPGVTLSRLHLGGGTPTLLPAALSNELIGAIFEAFPMADDGEFSVEIDPNEIDDARLDALVASGLNRASIGVQDFDTDVQAAIGRIQSYETTAHVVDGLRARGIKELNLDVLYGLPHQTLHGIKATLDQIVALDPSRIALFGYAHVPWMSKRQALISEDTLPQGEDRLALFLTAAKHLQDAGYPQFGIDHFAKPDDPLAQAFSDGKLRRNFQGYTEDQSEVLLGLGASSISRFPQGYAQNQSATAIYAKAISLGRLSAARGHEFSEDDKLNAAIIEQLMCYYRVEVGGVAARTGAADATVRAVLQQIHESHPKMTQLDGDCLEIEAEARDWVRVIASAADQYTAAGRAHSFAV